MATRTIILLKLKVHSFPPVETDLHMFIYQQTF